MPMLPLCHARVSPCVMPASRLSCPPPICHARLPFVIPAKAGIQSLFPIRHVLVRGGGRGAGVIDPSISKLTPAGRVQG